MGKLLGGNFKNVLITDIDRPKEAIRLDINKDDVDELAANIAENGLLQPILVRQENGRFEVIAGDRRFMACQSLGWKQIPCIVKQVGDEEVAVSRASENLARVNLTPVEEAAIYQNLAEKHYMTWQEIAKTVGKSPGIVKRRLLIMKMPANLQKELHRGRITMQIAEELWSLRDEAAVDYYLGYCVDHGATVAVVRSWVKDHKRSKENPMTDIEGGVSPKTEYESRPVYVPCDICNSPMQVGEETIYRACPECSERLRTVTK